MTAEIQGLTTAYYDSDPENPDNRPVVLFLHGWGAPVATYTLLLEHLSCYCRVVAPDLPGFGGTAEPPRPWSVDDYADWTLAFARTLGLSRVVLMNHSFGGRISIKLLSRRPAPLEVEQAVFMDAAGIPPKHGLGYYVKVYSFKAMKAVLSLPGIRSLWPDAVENARRRRGSADYQAASPLMRQTMVRCIGEDLTPLLPSIEASVLLIWGEADTATPLSDGQTMEKRIPDAGLVVLPGAGHFAFSQQWGLCSRVLDSFLKPRAAEPEQE